MFARSHSAEGSSAAPHERRVSVIVDKSGIRFRRRALGDRSQQHPIGLISGSASVERSHPQSLR